ASKSGQSAMVGVGATTTIGVLTLGTRTQGLTAVTTTTSVGSLISTGGDPFPGTNLDEVYGPDRFIVGSEFTVFVVLP
ncbi:MAG TPA: hypothetical protein VK467_10345, partial [Gemmatimonadales bacterium]|nr:hypothetical protein [Gemmatimonadales bacterium]